MADETVTVCGLGAVDIIAKNQTWIQDLLIQDQDQDQDSAVSRPRPRFAYPRPRPRPRLKTYKTNTGSP